MKMSNAYYDEAKEALAQWNNGNGNIDLDFNSFKLRTELIPRYSFAVPNDEAIQAIKSLNLPIIEIGAGTGYWANLIAQSGVDIICFDTYCTKYHHGEWINCWYEVRNGGPEKIKENPNRALFLCWPDYEKAMASDCLENYTGDIVIYVGERGGGCTANDKFFAILDKDFELIKTIEIPQWWGIHDSLFIYKRINKKLVRQIWLGDY